MGSFILKRTFFGVFIFLFGINIFSLDTVIYPKKQSATDSRCKDLIEILEVALEKTKNEYGDYKLIESTALMNEKRLVTEVESGKYLNVLWNSANSEIDNKLIAINIPTRKGILGYRIFLIRKDMQDTFSSLKSVDELRNYSVGQGKDWDDVKVYNHNGFKVEGSTTYEGLFPMLVNNRFDFFARGLNEAFPEQEAREDKFPEIKIEESIVLYYPWPYLFYVSPNNPQIAKRIEKGMRMMIEDGTLDNIFMKYNADIIKKAKLEGRKLFKLENPDLSQDLAFGDSSLWFNPYK